MPAIRRPKKANTAQARVLAAAAAAEPRTAAEACWRLWGALGLLAPDSYAAPWAGLVREAHAALCAAAEAAPEEALAAAAAPPALCARAAAAPALVRALLTAQSLARSAPQGPRPMALPPPCGPSLPGLPLVYCADVP